ncbi:MFS transporter [Paenibacillus albicereus]|uniref:MFS transporter n=1 Tax=Paenibacillus albicereus TaxID=2726185 RepID=A0A6H2GU99_9BACL|nr:MFS transporter [Paenibacillus albicereus]QJC50977.1 MFS transporter [Paenibacillus albicereus]
MGAEPLTLRKEPLWTRSFIVLTLGAFLMFLCLQMLMSPLPSYVEERFAPGAFVISLVTSLFALAAIAARFATAWMLGRISRHVVLFAGLALSALATLGFSAARSIEALLALRVLFGIGFGMASTVLPTLVTGIIPPRRMGEGVGYFGLSSSMAMSLGPMIGLAIMDGIGFRALSLTGAASSLVIIPLLLVFRAIPPVRRREPAPSGGRTAAAGSTGARASAGSAEPGGRAAAERADAGLAGARASAGSAETGVRAAAERADAGSAGAGASAGSAEPGGRTAAERADAGSAAAGAVDETGHSEAGQAWLPALLNALMAITYGGLLSYLVLFGREMGLPNIGLFFLLNAVAILLVRPIAGRLFDRHGHLAVLPAASLLLMGGLLLLSWSDTTGLLLLSALLYGLGFGSIQPTAQAWMLRSMPASRQASANSLFYNSTDLGVAVGSMLLGAVAASTGYALMYRWAALSMVLLLAAYGAGLAFSRRRAVRAS